MNQHSQTRRYHHGDLQYSLLQAAIELLAEGPPEQLSMRKLADRAGVSRTAPYHHFKDKNALLCEIAIQGFNALAQQLPKADSPGDAEQQLLRYVEHYLDYSEQQPAHYDLMFGRDIWKLGEPSPALVAVSRDTFKRWESLVTELQQQQLLPSGKRIAQLSWAQLHGFCRLYNDGIYTGEEPRSQMASSLVGYLLRK